jgi:prevent-host-death family protein
MAMVLTASKLRENIYRILDQVLETGVPVEIRRRGKTVKIVPAEAVPKLSRLAPRDYLRGDPEAIVHLDWSSEWRP